MLQHEKLILRIIWVCSFVVPIAVAVMLNPAFPKFSVGFNTKYLSSVNASINAGVTILLLLGFYFIRQKKYIWHKRVMLGAFALSAIFLLSYILYHLTNGHTIYREDCGPVPKPLYLFILYSHIGFSGIIIPLASFSIFRALSEKYDKHRRIARITLPLWLYITITGVLVYLMISPCYS